MGRLILITAMFGVALSLAVPARAGVIADLLTVLGLTSAPASHSAPGGVTPDNCDTGECEQQ